jgi:hypothetical protein
MGLFSKDESGKKNKKSSENEDPNALPQEQQEGGVGMQRDTPVNATDENKRVVQNLGAPGKQDPNLNLTPEKIREQEADGSHQEKMIEQTAKSLEEQQAQDEEQRKLVDQRKAGKLKIDTDEELAEFAKAMKGKLVVVFDNPQAFRRFFREEQNLSVVTNAGETIDGTIIARSSGHSFNVRGAQNKVTEVQMGDIRRVIVH